jgi:2-amino-4-hydroxy-6-hydroxymethyldihydropteridine diphosphokinase
VSPFIGLGSNVGDRLAYLRAAMRALDETPGVELVTWSSVYDTDPVGPEQPNFLNAVVAVDTTLTARQLFTRLKQIERELGRVEREPQGPREIDLDLLLFGDAVIDEPDL